MKIILGYFTFLATLVVFLVFLYMLLILLVYAGTLLIGFHYFLTKCTKKGIAYCKQKIRKKEF